MAIISGLPNFFNATTVLDSDYNNAAKAILLQVGGMYFDEAGTAYAQSAGNLDNTNFVSTNTGIRNNQKNEPFAIFTMSQTAIWDTTNLVWGDMATFGPLGVPFTILGLKITGATQGLTLLGSTATTPSIVAINVNNATAFAYALGAMPNTSGIAKSDPVYVTLANGLLIGPNDTVVVDLTRTSVSATAGAGQTFVTLVCSSPHYK